MVKAYGFDEAQRLCARPIDGRAYALGHSRAVNVIAFGIYSNNYFEVRRAGMARDVD